MIPTTARDDQLSIHAFRETYALALGRGPGHLRTGGGDGRGTTEVLDKMNVTSSEVVTVGARTELDIELGLSEIENCTHGR